MSTYPREYSAHWEKPEWIYDQVLKIEKRIKSDEMVKLKEKSVALFQQRMAKEHEEMFIHYTKIFFRVINGCLTKTLLLMLLKQRQKMDNGEVSYDEGNHEVIGASFNMMLKSLPEEMREKVANTYTDLVQEEREETKKAIREKLAEMGVNVPSQEKEKEEMTTETSTSDETAQVAHDAMQRVREMSEAIHRAPQRIEVVDVGPSKLDQDLEKLQK